MLTVSSVVSLVGILWLNFVFYKSNRAGFKPEISSQFKYCFCGIYKVVLDIIQRKLLKKGDPNDKKKSIKVKKKLSDKKNLKNLLFRPLFRFK